MRAKARNGFEVPKPTREELHAALTYDAATDTFWWIRNPAKRVRHRQAGYISHRTKGMVRMLHFGGFNHRFDTIKAIFFSELTDDAPICSKVS